MATDLHEKYAELKMLILEADARGDREEVERLQRERAKVYEKLAAASGHSHGPSNDDDEHGDDEKKSKPKSKKR